MKFGALQKAFKFVGIIHSDFISDLNQQKYKDQLIGVPQELDWVNVRRMLVYLEKFYDFTILVSDTTYVTSHLFFKEMCDVFDLINELKLHEDDEISKMAMKMKMKLEKYWFVNIELNPRMNKILYIAALLDPRQKMKHVEMCLKVVYGEKRGTELVGEVNNLFREFFQFYKKQMTPTPTPRANASTSGCTAGRLNHRGPRGTSSCCILPVVTDEQPDATDMSEIDVYFIEKQYRMTANEVDNFDILQWWLKHGPRYPVLSEMARDILAIPVSSDDSKSAFSMEGRVLSEFRSSLTTNMVEALICAENWLKSSSSDIFLKDEEDVPETELEKEFETVLITLGLGGGPNWKKNLKQVRTPKSAQKSQLCCVIAI